MARFVKNIDKEARLRRKAYLEERIRALTVFRDVQFISQPRSCCFRLWERKAMSAAAPPISRATTTSIVMPAAPVSGSCVMDLMLVTVTVPEVVSCLTKPHVVDSSAFQLMVSGLVCAGITVPVTVKVGSVLCMYPLGAFVS